MLMILGLLAALLVPLPSHTEGKKVKGLRFIRDEQPNERRKKVSNDAEDKVFPIAI